MQLFGRLRGGVQAEIYIHYLHKRLDSRKCMCTLMAGKYNFSEWSLKKLFTINFLPAICARLFIASIFSMHLAYQFPSSWRYQQTGRWNKMVARVAGGHDRRRSLSHRSSTKHWYRYTPPVCSRIRLPYLNRRKKWNHTSSQL